MYSPMRIATKVLALAIAGFFVLSCSRDGVELEVEEVPSMEEYEPVADFLQLQVGNYWVYESFSINLETGEETPLHKRDSVYVLKDTLIGRSSYFILQGSRLGREYRSILRCSGPEVMDSEGHLLFSTASIGDTSSLSPSLLVDGTESGEYCVQFFKNMEVPYGIFDGLKYQRTFTLPSSEEIRAGGKVRHQSDYFAKGVGLIQYTSFLLNQPLDIELRLVRSNVQ